LDAYSLKIMLTLANYLNLVGEKIKQNSGTDKLVYTERTTIRIRIQGKTINLISLQERQHKGVI